MFATRMAASTSAIICERITLCRHASKHGRSISGRKRAGSVTGSKGGVVCALA
jgi:hypothetical protein